jgi:Flp pilus assembly protein CpaB
MRRSRIIILFAIILLLGAAALYLIISRGSGEQAQPEGTPEGVMPSDIVFVAIAAQDIARGTRIPEDGVVMSRMPANMVVETMISGPDEEGIRSRVVDRIARQDIGRGVPITEKMLTESSGDLLAGGSDAALAIPPGYTAISIPINRLSGVAYAIRDGDVVDVLVTMMLVDVDPDFQSILPNFSTIIAASGGTEEFPAPSLTGAVQPFEEEGRGDRFFLGKVEEEDETGQLFHLVPQEDQRPRVVTQRLVENARVLHVGTFALDEEGAASAQIAEEGVGAPPPPEGQQVAVVESQPPDIITLIVTPQDALAINYTIKTGTHMTLTLRAPNDTEVTETTSVTLQYLIDTYNVTIPTKLPYAQQPALESLITPKLSNDQPAAAPQQ